MNLLAKLAAVRGDWQGFWSARQDPGYGSEHPDFVCNYGREISILLGDCTGKRILELGCGTGTLYPILGFEDAKVYRGVDFSQSMLDAFRARHPGVEVICTDASSYRDSNQYEIVFSNAVVQYFSLAMFERHVRNARTMLAPGGRFYVCSVPWRRLRATYHLQPARDAATRYLRHPALLCLSYLGIDRIGTWYSFRDFRRVARLNGLKVQFFGCLVYPYRFHAVFETASSL
jgi:SAM-dependent methyltransferase